MSVGSVQRTLVPLARNTAASNAQQAEVEREQREPSWARTAVSRPVLPARTEGVHPAAGLHVMGARAQMGRIADILGPFELDVVRERAIGRETKTPESSLRALSHKDFYVRRAGMESIIRRGSDPLWQKALIDFIAKPPKESEAWAKYHAVASLARIAASGDEGAIRACLSLVGTGFDSELGVGLQHAPEKIVRPALDAMTDPKHRAGADYLERVRDAARRPPREPGMTFPYLPLANGSTTAMFALEDGSIRSIRDTIFSNPSLGPSAPAVEKLFLIPSVDGKVIVPGTERLLDARYGRGTPSAEMRTEAGGLELTRTLIAPMDPHAIGGSSAITVLVHAKNISKAPLELGLYATTNPAKLARRAPTTTLSPGAESWFELTVDPSAVKIPPALPASATEPPILSQAAAQGEAALAEARARIAPLPLSDAEKELYLQCQTFLRMGQAKDGAVAASVPPGHWNIAWVRDMSYALVAMAESGMHAQAERGLEYFFGRDHSTAYESYDFEGYDLGVGRPYQISVVRHYEDGREESDWVEGSPNIEFDGFGLALWALERYIEKSGDTGFAAKHWDNISRKTGDVIADLIDETGLIKRDSSIWERHLPGRRFTYTSAACERGLRAVANVAERLGKSEDSARWRSAADGLRKAIDRHQVTRDGVVVGFAGDLEPEKTLDVSAIEVFNWGVIDVNTPDGFEVALRTLAAYREHLGVEDSPGFQRTVNEGWYEEQEWVVLDLRVASAMYRMARSPEAEKRGMSAELLRGANELLEWVQLHMKANHNVIAELLGAGNRLYEGAIPMVGYGPGALIMALEDKAAAVAAISEPSSPS